MNEAQEQLDALKQQEDENKQVLQDLYETIPLNHRRQTVDAMTGRSKEQIEEIIKLSKEAQEQIHQENKEFLIKNRSESKEFLAEVTDVFEVAGGIKEFTAELKKTNDFLEDHLTREQNKKSLLSKIIAFFRSESHE